MEPKPSFVGCFIGKEDLSGFTFSGIPTRVFHTRMCALTSGVVMRVSTNSHMHRFLAFRNY
jgi:hypothetical protein